MAKRKLKVGFDFDGVIAYNPLRIFRLPVTLFKRLFLKEKTLKFYYPKTKFEKWIWELLHETSFLPAVGFSTLKKMLEEDQIEAYLITARYSFLDKSWQKWLKKYKSHKIFTGYYLNKKNEQPHKFKERMIKKLNLDVYIDDNWDIVNYLSFRFGNSSAKSKAGRAKQNIEIHWIYNVVDRFKPYKNKHPYLKKFLESLACKA